MTNDIYKNLQIILSKKNLIILNINSIVCARVFSPIFIQAINNSQKNPLKNVLNSSMNIKNFSRENWSYLNIHNTEDFINYINKEDIELANIDQSFLLVDRSLKDNFKLEHLKNLKELFISFDQNKMPKLQQMVIVNHSKSLFQKITLDSNIMKNVSTAVISINETGITIDDRINLPITIKINNN